MGNDEWIASNELPRGKSFNGMYDSKMIVNERNECKWLPLKRLMADELVR
jgi:hypothetical protein